MTEWQYDTGGQSPNGELGLCAIYLAIHFSAATQTQRSQLDAV
jgi:hypothetical protein